jgi:LPS-assembly protein
LDGDTPPRESSHGVSIITGAICHGFFACLSAVLCFAALAAAQTAAPPAVQPPVAPPARPRKYKVEPPVALGEREVLIQAIKQMKEGAWYRLRGSSQVQTTSFLLKADDIDYNEDTGEVEARGNVYLQHFEGGEQLWADRAEYNLNDEAGKFWNVRGEASLAVPQRPRLLTTTNPFYFQGKWAERVKEKYVLHDGFITDCKMPRPWWILRGPVFNIIPNDHAIGYRSIFLMRHVPLFYFPVIYKALNKEPRRSGFLTPNIGNSTQRGQMIGVGFYWAINRSYDATYRVQYYTARGFAHTVDVRGTPFEGTEFNAFLYGVNDKGVRVGKTIQKQGGFTLEMQARSDLGHGFYGRAEINYLSSFLFRQSFTESYNEAISSEVHSSAFVTRQWSSYGLDFVFQRLENFQSTRPGDAIIIRKLPEVDFTSREHRLWQNVPLWVSWDSSVSLLRRQQPLFQTASFVNREDINPRIATALRWKGITVMPSFAVRETHWGDSRDEAFHIVGKDVTRSGREVDVDLSLPSLARFYKPPKWLGDRLKHVIEAGATYRYVTGVNNFNSLVRFDDTELFSNTNEAEIWITNRLYAKRGDQVDEILSWDIRQKRYFDPTFGGAVTNGWCGTVACRNVVLSSIELTPYAFLDGPRTYSPLVSSLRARPRPGLGIEWRADYDPLRHKLVDSSLTADYTFGKGLYNVSLGHNSSRNLPVLSPNANQLRGSFRVGNENRRGWSAGFMTVYDFRIGSMQWATTQVTYNTNCCGFSLQYRRLNFGSRFENQYRLALAIANIGSFGTLKKQERMF